MKPKVGTNTTIFGIFWETYSLVYHYLLNPVRCNCLLKGGLLYITVVAAM